MREHILDIVLLVAYSLEKNGGDEKTDGVTPLNDFLEDLNVKDGNKGKILSKRCEVPSYRKEVNTRMINDYE